MRKRYYIIFVAREEDGRLRKIPVPLHYAYIFVAAAIVGAFTITGMAGSYSRMLLKTASFNQVRSQHEALRKDYAQLEQVAHEKEVQAASLGSLANEVSALYGLRQNKLTAAKSRITATAPVLSDGPDNFSQQAYSQSFDQLNALRRTALSGQVYQSFGLGTRHPFGSLDDALNLANAPSLWPVVGPVTSSFGEREDPFNGEGAFHAGVDISSTFGEAVRATADGTVEMADRASGYGREIVIDHGFGIKTVYGHLSGFAVTEGQQVTRGQVIGYVGTSGRSTGPHLHYEVRVRNTPVNPHKYLRDTMQQLASTGSSMSAGGGAN
ncbi:peptidoglycan DD-metalloendopeptidase family protein [Alloacidobacterium dinghuense]|uniref:Peptidoglycan DD-metalloendopeptidase family protein n=1 Tax=Alloacidobacterium dinghuense TaxID=2763107 RepID=A0A7G8BGW3_9BACT|nr:M23 family metallopeptidase [Alloacidobacterium dinghuense]QNI31783.1 peptidoglycan DD-metalloendopeptidase family protein [Alloacidobacterium dinghuense]